MKNGFRDIVGRQIAAVYVAHNKDAYPNDQIFLVVTDGTRFEIYGGDITCCSGLEKAEGIERYVTSAGGKLTAHYVDHATSLPRPRLTTGPVHVPYVGAFTGPADDGDGDGSSGDR